MACETDVRLFKSMKVQIQSFKIVKPCPQTPSLQDHALEPRPRLGAMSGPCLCPETGSRSARTAPPPQHRPLCEVRLAPLGTSLTPGGLFQTLTGLTRLAPPPPPWSNIHYAALFLFVSPGLRHCAQSTWLLSQTFL